MAPNLAPFILLAILPKGSIINLLIARGIAAKAVPTFANNYSLDLAKLNTVTSAMTGSDTLTFGDSGDDTQVTIKGNLTVIGTTTTNNVETVSTSNGIQFEGTAADGHDAILKSVVASSVSYTHLTLPTTPYV